MKSVANHRPTETIDSPKTKATNKDMQRVRSKKRPYSQKMPKMQKPQLKMEEERKSPLGSFNDLAMS
jgi:hypothetical protein